MKKLLLVFMVILILLMTGCWDMVEVNQRIYPYSVAIDLNPGEGGRYIISVSYPNIYAIGSNPSQDERVLVISTISDSIFQGTRELSTRLQYPFYFKNLKVVVLGQEFAMDEDSVRELIDGINRDPIINKKIRLVTAEEMGKDILLNIPKASRQEVIEGTLFSMLKDGKKTSRYTPQTLTEFIRDMDVIGVSTTPRATFQGEDIKIYGACIYRDYRFIGHLGELENRSIALLRGDVKEEIVEADFKGLDITYSINGAKVKKSLDKDSKDLKIKLAIEVEGSLKEYIQRDSREELTEKLLKEMEKSIGDKLEGQIKNSIEKMQKEMEADVLGIGQYLNKFHPSLWKEVEKDWQLIFPEIEIEASVTAYIRRRGLVQ